MFTITLIISYGISANIISEKIEPNPEFGKRPKTIVYAPLSQNSKLPLVFLLHGHGANGYIQNLYLGLKKEIRKKDFILALPTGTRDKAGHRFWNDEILNLGFLRGHSDDDEVVVDDLGFLNNQIEKIIDKYNVDIEQIYLIGHSNGGFLSYSYACNGKYPIKKVIVLAGGITRKLECNRKFDILHIHGTNDGLVNYNGRKKYFYSVEENMNFWVNQFGCLRKERLENKDLIFIKGKETEVFEWTDCNNSKKIELWKINNGLHVPIFRPKIGKILIEKIFF